MPSFQIISENEVRTEARGAEYTVLRCFGGFRVFCVNASSRAYRRGYPVGRQFSTLDDVEQAYKGLQGISGAFA